MFAALVDYLRSGDLLVLNDTSVLKARLWAQKAETGGRVELLVVEPRAVSPSSEVWKVMLRASKPPRVGQFLRFPGGERAEVVDELGEGFYELHFSEPVMEFANRYGALPLPPYLGRAAEPSDDERYQTIYRDPRKARSVAAPTAGLHFTAELFEALDRRGVERTHVTLHVGPGTFLPVRSEDTREHHMHEEHYVVSGPAATAIEQAREEGRRVVAVGTTSARVLESFDGAPGPGKTRLFIQPGFRFSRVDALLTNFHLPKSTLLMLVAAFAGREQTLSAYAEAIRLGYRFYSYGDAMFIERQEGLSK